MRLKVDLNIVLTEFEGSGKLVWIYFKEEEFVTMRDVSAKLKREYPGLGGSKVQFLHSRWPRAQERVCGNPPIRRHPRPQTQEP